MSGLSPERLAQIVARDAQNPEGPVIVNSYGQIVWGAQDRRVLLAEVKRLTYLLGSHADGHRCTCTVVTPRTLHSPDEWEQNPWCPTHPAMDHVLAEVKRLRAQIAAVETLLNEHIWCEWFDAVRPDGRDPEDCSTREPPRGLTCWPCLIRRALAVGS